MTTMGLRCLACYLVDPSYNVLHTPMLCHSRYLSLSFKFLCVFSEWLLVINDKLCMFVSSFKHLDMCCNTYWGRRVGIRRVCVRYYQSCTKTAGIISDLCVSSLLPLREAKVKSKYWHDGILPTLAFKLTIHRPSTVFHIWSAAVPRQPLLACLE